uniref:Uncharacterized protein n=1 Tax=Anguilla anguilla TaxID=7936 RepID=A0A0E9TH12_ANGAN
MCFQCLPEGGSVSSRQTSGLKLCVSVARRTQQRWQESFI